MIPESIAAEAQGAAAAPDDVQDVQDVDEPAKPPAGAWSRFKRLFQATERTPAQLTGHLIPRTFNRLVDRRGPTHAAKAELGESTTLCIETLLETEAGGSSTPAGYLLQSIVEYERYQYEASQTEDA